MTRLGGSGRPTSLFDEFWEGADSGYANVGVRWEGDARAQRMSACCAVVARWYAPPDA